MVFEIIQLIVGPLIFLGLFLEYKQRQQSNAPKKENKPNDYRKLYYILAALPVFVILFYLTRGPIFQQILNIVSVVLLLLALVWLYSLIFKKKLT